MSKRLWPIALALLSLHGAADAAAVEVDVRDLHGHAVAGAVIELVPALPGAAMPTSKLPSESIIDQRHETFLPLVTLIRKGGRVTFTNNDTTMHQVYSFSPTRQFAFEIDEGQRSQPVIFDKPGVAAIGCNIHDHMITYVYVAATPWAALSEQGGRTIINGAPPGSYRVTVWHPQLPPGSPEPSFPLEVTDSPTKTGIAVPVTVANTQGRKPMHMQMY